MYALGHEQPICDGPAMSASPPRTTKSLRRINRRLGPVSDMRISAPRLDIVIELPQLPRDRHSLRHDFIRGRHIALDPNQGLMIIAHT